MNNRFIFSSILTILVLLGAWYVFAGVTAVTLISPADGTNTSNNDVVFECSGDPEGTEAIRNISVGLNNTGNATNQLILNNTNTTLVANASNLTVANLEDGRFVWNCLAANNSAIMVRNSSTFITVSPNVNATVGANFSRTNRTVIVDTTGPNNVTLIFPNDNSSNISFKNLTNADFTNGSVTVRWTVHDAIMTVSSCNLTVNDVVRATNVEGYSGGNSSQGVGDAANFTSSVRGFNSLITNNSWSVACSDFIGNGQNLSRVSQAIQIIDTTRPYEVGPLTFKGTVDGRADVDAVKFDYGSKITITGCNGTENVDYFNSNATIDIKLPGSTGFKRLVNGTSGVSSFVFDDTQDLGTYEVNCTYIDGSGNGNSTVKKFEILSTRIRGSGAAAIPGFKFSKGTTLIGSDSRNDAGSLTPTDSSWLFRSGGTIVFQVAGAKHSFQVKEIKDKSVVVTVSSTPFDVEVNEGETKNVDVDGDGSADVAITLNGFTPSRQADLTFKAVGGIPAEAGPGISEEKAPTVGGPITAGVGNGTWLIVGIIVVVLIVGYFLIKRR